MANKNNQKCFVQIRKCRQRQRRRMRMLTETNPKSLASSFILFWYLNFENSTIRSNLNSVLTICSVYSLIARGRRGLSRRASRGQQFKSYRPHFFEMESKENFIHCYLWNWFVGCGINLTDLLTLVKSYCRNWVRKRGTIIMEELWVNRSILKVTTFQFTTNLMWMHSRLIVVISKKNDRNDVL